ncbi:MAG TPA: hypothetical protein VG889_14995 [Rhizomicrobium sp.]|nr:hypothetical protein [Rhizomicrobium sp.]
MTPYRVCVLGNSHSAALHMAWKNRLAPEMANVAMTFFAAKSQLMRHMTLTNGVLVPDDRELGDLLAATSGGLRRIDLSGYDAFVLAGLGARITLTALCKDHGTVAHGRWGEPDNLVSQNCFRAMLAAGLADNIAFWLLDRIRESGSTAPALICPTPLYSEIELERPFMRRHPRLGDAAFRAAVMEEGKRIAFDLAAAHGGEMVWQDESTIAAPGYTKREFARAALRLGKNPTDDGKHMNEDYGVVVLGNVLKRLDALSEGRVLARDTVVPFRRKSA